MVCDGADVQTEHAHPHQQRPRPSRVILFDARPGGLGVAEQIFRRIDLVLEQALAVLTGCPCAADAGCETSRRKARENTHYYYYYHHYYYYYYERERERERKTPNITFFSPNQALLEPSTRERGTTCAGPACLHDQRCSAYNLGLDRLGAICVLEHIIAEHGTALLRDGHRHPAGERHDKAPPTPRRKRRGESLRDAAAMDAARQAGQGLRAAWAPFLPDVLHVAGAD